MESHIGFVGTLMGLPVVVFIAHHYLFAPLFCNPMNTRWDYLEEFFWNSFKKIILSKVAVTIYDPIWPYPENVSDMLKFFGGKKKACRGAFTPSQVLAMTNSQNGGRRGDLLTDGYRNIFFVIEDDTLYLYEVYWDVDDPWFDWEERYDPRWTTRFHRIEQDIYSPTLSLAGHVRIFYNKMWF